MARFKTGTWKLRGLKKGSERIRCLVFSEDEDVVHILLKFSERRKWREQFWGRKWLMLNEGISYKKITNCTNIRELNVGICLYNITCKWEDEIRNFSSELRGGGGGGVKQWGV
jgi:hypothetical protein